MNIEIDQQQKFTEEFEKLAEDASQKFKDKWNNEIRFVDPTHRKLVPAFNPGVLDLLSVELRKKYELLREKYFHKAL